MVNTIGLCVEPLDVLFFRDGRPFTGAERSVSGLPMPQTCAGAIRTALLRAAGCDFKALGEVMENGATFAAAVQRSCAREHHWIGYLVVRGPWLARGKNGDGFDVLVPAPATLHREKAHPGHMHRLAPLPDGQLPGWNPPSDQQGLRPLWLKHLAATEPVAGYVTPRGLDMFLRGAEVEPADIVSPDDLFSLDYRTGIGISPDRLVAADSQIFGRGFLALKDSVFLYLEMVLAAEVHDGTLLPEIETIPLGGEGRYARLRCVEPISWPDPRTQGRQKPLILLTTPCAFEAGWKPRALSGHVAAAAVPGSLAFSGWDLARGGPKRTRFAVPPGSVYLLNSMPDEWAGTLAESDDDRQMGWGCCLKGVWTDE
jgi:CRISPR-associated protein Cmr3